MIKALNHQEDITVINICIICVCVYQTLIYLKVDIDNNTRIEGDFNILFSTIQTEYQ